MPCLFCLCLRLLFRLSVCLSLPARDKARVLRTRIFGLLRYKLVN